MAIGGGAAAAAAGVAVGATAANSPGRRKTFDEADDQEGLSTSMNGKAAQLDLSRASAASAKSGAGQQENTAIEVEYVDPDYYTSDEDEDQDEYDHRGRPVAAAAGGAAAAVGAKKKKDKKKGRGISKGLSKMFGKAQTSKKRDTDPAKVAAAAAAAAGAGAAIATHGDEAGTLTDEDESQSTADHAGDDVEEEPQVVRVPVVPGSEGWTVDEKNAHLQAMASKARDSYMYGKGSPPPSPKRGAAAHVSDGVPDDSSVPEDDYADWRPSEKRRFLQLLSQGMSPREAAREIKNARRGIDSADAESPQAGATADESGTPDDEAALDESGAVGDTAGRAVDADGEVEGEQAKTSTNPFNDDAPPRLPPPVRVPQSPLMATRPVPSRMRTSRRARPITPATMWRRSPRSSAFPWFPGPRGGPSTRRTPTCRPWPARPETATCTARARPLPRRSAVLQRTSVMGCPTTPRCRRTTTPTGGPARSADSCSF